MKLLIGIAIGAYLMGAIATFLFVGFFCVLGGNAADLWKPVVYGAGWPLFWLYLLCGGTF